jgi:AmmeMemoRadiSam system protein A
VKRVQPPGILRPVLLLFLLLTVALGGADSLSAAEQGRVSAREQEPGKKEGKMEDPTRLTEEDGRYLLSVARETIEESLFQRKPASDSTRVQSPICSEKRGTFVTLTTGGALRGCIGHIIAQESLLEGVRINAINAAFKDPRFKPLSPKEWEKVKIEVSILTDPAPLSYSDGQDLRRKLRPGVDGVILKKGFHQATFLPQVWEQLPNVDEFLMHLCLKAGLDGNAWKREKLEVLTYQVQAFHE